MIRAFKNRYTPHKNRYTSHKFPVTAIARIPHRLNIRVVVKQLEWTIYNYFCPRSGTSILFSWRILAFSEAMSLLLSAIQQVCVTSERPSSNVYSATAASVPVIPLACSVRYACLLWTNNHASAGRQALLPTIQSQCVCFILCLL